MRRIRSGHCVGKLFRDLSHTSPTKINTTRLVYITQQISTIRQQNFVRSGIQRYLPFAGRRRAANLKATTTQLSMELHADFPPARHRDRDQAPLDSTFMHDDHTKCAKISHHQHVSTTTRKRPRREKVQFFTISSSCFPLRYKLTTKLIT